MPKGWIKNILSFVWLSLSIYFGYTFWILTPLLGLIIWGSAFFPLFDIVNQLRSMIDRGRKKYAIALLVCTLLIIIIIGFVTWLLIEPKYYGIYNLKICF